MIVENLKIDHDLWEVLGKRVDHTQHSQDYCGCWGYSLDFCHHVEALTQRVYSPGIGALSHEREKRVLLTICPGLVYSIYVWMAEYLLA